jgi:hypothetical protein
MKLSSFFLRKMQKNKFDTNPSVWVGLDFSLLALGLSSQKSSLGRCFWMTPTLQMTLE